MCMFFFLNCSYYSHEWLSEYPSRELPHEDRELTAERKKKLQKAIS